MIVASFAGGERQLKVVAVRNSVRAVLGRARYEREYVLRDALLKLLETCCSDVGL